MMIIAKTMENNTAILSVEVYKKMNCMNGTFSVTHVSNEVMDVFRLSGLDKKLDIRAKENV